MATPRWYAKQSNANPGIALQNIARFMCNTLPTFTGPGWVCVQVYSAAAVVQWDTPAASDFTALPSDNSWKPGNTPAVGDFVVLRSASASNKGEVAIQYQSSTNWRIIACPYQGWLTSAHNTTVENAGNWTTGFMATVTEYTVPAGVANYSVICDEDLMIPLVEAGGAPVMTYIGKGDQADSTDATPFVIYTQPTVVYVGGFNSGYWRRISPVNNTTEATMYSAPLYPASLGDPYTGAVGFLRNTVSGKYVQSPMMLISGTVGHMSTIVLRYITGAWQGIQGSGVGTEDSLARLVVSSSAGQGCITVLWDGATAY